MPKVGDQYISIKPGYIHTGKIGSFVKKHGDNYLLDFKVAFNGNDVDNYQCFIPKDWLKKSNLNKIREKLGIK